VTNKNQQKFFSLQPLCCAVRISFIHGTYILKVKYKKYKKNPAGIPIRRHRGAGSEGVFKFSQKGYTALVGNELVSMQGGTYVRVGR